MRVDQTDLATPGAGQEILGRAGRGETDGAEERPAGRTEAGDHRVLGPHHGPGRDVLPGDHEPSPLTGLPHLQPAGKSSKIRIHVFTPSFVICISDGFL